MKLTTEQKQANKRQRRLNHAEQFRPHIYMTKFTAPSFQKMIRALSGARVDRLFWYVQSGVVYRMSVAPGWCVCITCGNMQEWSSGGTQAQNRGGIQTGHFIASRANSIVLQERNAAPQCARCNIIGSGEQANYEIWMRHVYGQAEIDRLMKLKNGPVRKFTREELVDLRIGYEARTKKAVEKMS